MERGAEEISSPPIRVTVPRPWALCAPRRSPGTLPPFFFLKCPEEKCFHAPPRCPGPRGLAAWPSSSPGGDPQPWALARRPRPPQEARGDRGILCGKGQQCTGVFSPLIEISKVLPPPQKRKKKNDQKIFLKVHLKEKLPRRYLGFAV